MLVFTGKKLQEINILKTSRDIRKKSKLNGEQSQNKANHTFSGRLLASAIFAIGKADVFDAYMQCSGMCYKVTQQLNEL